MWICSSVQESAGKMQGKGIYPPNFSFRRLRAVKVCRVNKAMAIAF